MRVIINDEFGPEANAMMQALYSRSPASVVEHIKQVKKTGSSKFMESFYVGYGHASIGDCGTTTLFFENVSILAAKAIQDNPLYSGQETSTRYIDFSNQPKIDPIGTKESQEILSNWIDFYVSASEPVRAHLKSLFPLKDGQNSTTWEKAINARSFDILRGFLPAGMTTQLSWSTNLRQAHDKLSMLKYHPLKEVREIAEIALEKLSTKYPSSFCHKKRDEIEAFHRQFAERIHYPPTGKLLIDNDFIYHSTIENEILESNEFDVLRSRPKGALLPKHMKGYGQYTCRFYLDYGSFRDIQRHRNGVCKIPVLKGDYFNKWYIDQLPENLQDDARKLIFDQNNKVQNLALVYGASDIDLQYYLPIGTNVICEVAYDLTEMVYVTELRSSQTVHPTLRKVAHVMHNILTENHPELKLYTDLSEDKFDVRRGTQDIVKK